METTFEFYLRYFGAMTSLEYLAFSVSENIQWRSVLRMTEQNMQSFVYIV